MRCLDILTLKWVYSCHDLTTTLKFINNARVQENWKFILKYRKKISLVALSLGCNSIHWLIWIKLAQNPRHIP